MTKADTVLCISDLHLSAERPDLVQAFSGFLREKAAAAAALYILGDFFNAWIGDDEPADYAREIKTALRTLTDSGTRVYLMQGNRDFLLGEQFARETGSQLLADPSGLDGFGTSYLLMHGDSLCTRDTDYMAFREMVRSPQWQNAFLAKPLAERQAFAEQARAQSKAMSSNKADDIMDVTPSEVIRVLEENNETVLVHGHTHRPAIHDIDVSGQAGKRIVLGDWDTHAWWLEISPKGFELLNTPIEDLRGN